MFMVRIFWFRLLKSEMGEGEGETLDQAFHSSFFHSSL